MNNSKTIQMKKRNFEMAYFKFPLKARDKWDKLNKIIRIRLSYS